ncbi:3-oxoacid CoA-transferase subunit B [Aneurinibacillus sp. Ricciae_BoGa-3]|uniref:3-oxoacid CoA-transferase subunit B n=1 Tax=Aneurinibacillus sp. Ricciae_BoGa-3 TaxID=3022697 RepID=UPI00234201C1|nr:3-oxoacid CoA-transferase subunit B [Aneurinibacillus sp. Ricciae_BoGa-3]WCK52452.1 3-oxoacid CoA-transferase subunit B [Aneurinibacillus sp. Ricciae_BoGa-3]
MNDYKHYIAWRAAQEFEDGDIVNLGIGIPVLVADYLPQGRDIILHSENGILGVGPTPAPAEHDPDLINASKLPISENCGASYFDSALSFAMMRGGHIDKTVIGALQISERGDIANWAIPGKDVLGVGGAMDLIVGAKTVIVASTHLSPQGEPKILPLCTYPLTAKEEVDILITEFSVFSFRGGQMVLEELVDDLTLSELKEITPAHYVLSDTFRVVKRPEIFHNVHT